MQLNHSGFLALLVFSVWSSLSHSQIQRLADAPIFEPELIALSPAGPGNQSKAMEALNAEPNDIIFGQRASGFENASSDTPANDQEAARFLTQATFGPTIPEMGELKSIGYTAWIDRQLGLTPTLHRPFLEDTLVAQLASAPVGVGATRALRMERWFSTAAGASDQLRQRMAFALSQIIVVSDADGLSNQPISIAEYNDILVRNGLGSYRSLLKDVTYSPMMGQFLTTLRNQKTDWTLVNNVLTPSLVAPDENYAREIMQLFSIGLIQRNRDFTPVTVGGQPLPTYTQEIIGQTARALTGLTYSCSPSVTFGGSITLNHNCGCTGLACNFSTSAFFSNPQRYVVQPNSVLTALYHPDLYRPMMCNPRYADTGRSQTAANNYAVLPAPNNTKLIIGGVTIQPSPVACYSATPGADQQACVDYCTGQVDTIVDTLSSHPNVAPFIARQLIQRFVSSNPTSGYIGRVAAVFENDGSNVRGNLGAVIRAVLLDSEARSNSPSNNFGKLREPLLRLTAIWRAFGARPGSAGLLGLSFPERTYVQRPLGASSVFNFYEPDFQQSGEIADAGLFSPEFQIVDESTAISAADALYASIFAGYATNVVATTNFAIPANSAYLPPEEIDQLPNDNALLLDAINVRLLAGQMRPETRTKLLSLLNTGMSSTDKRRRALSAIHLLAISPEFAVQR
jgi:uncharacterized protein (DUF1800 family)